MFRRFAQGKESPSVQLGVVPKLSVRECHTRDPLGEPGVLLTLF